MFDSTHPAQQIGPQQVLRGPIKSAERPTIGPRPPTVRIVIRVTGYLIGAKCCFHWEALMQDTLDITGAGKEYDFVWLYTGYSILVQLKDTTQV